MINGKLSHFLDTGWYSESTLYYKGFVYWCEGYTDEPIGKSVFFVDRWKAECPDNKFYQEYKDRAGKLIGYERFYEDTDSDFDLLKKRFLQTAIFNGKSFWEIEKNLAWVDEGEPIHI